MSEFQLKYLKYKNKYLELKKHIVLLGGGDDELLFLQNNFERTSSRRLSVELKKLKENGYGIDFSEIANKVIKITDGDGVQFKIIIPSEYPFKNIILYSVAQKSNIHEHIITTIKKIPHETNNVLVYCHPRKINGRDDHFLFDSIIKTIEESSMENPNIYTLDTNGEPNILADGFSIDFINRYSANPSFNIVFLPDCSGLWFELQNTEDSSFDNIFDLINNILRIVKQNGKLIISKLIKPGLYDAILSHYPNSEPFRLVENESNLAIKINKIS